MKVPVDDGPGKVNFALMDQNGPENAWSCKALITMLWFHSGLVVLSGSWLTLVLGPGCPLVGLDGPGIGKGLPEDLVLVLDTDGLVSAAGWSCNDLIPMGILLCLCEGVFLMGIGMLWTWGQLVV